MKIDCKDLRVAEGKTVNLKKWPTRVKLAYKSKKAYARLLEEQVQELSAQQPLHYACNQYALLLIIQAMTLPARTAPSGSAFD